MFRITCIVLGIAIASCFVPPAQAGLFRHQPRVRQTSCQMQRPCGVPAPAAQASPTSVPAQPVTTGDASGDPHGFTAWLNATRAQHGLGAVGHDPNLSAWCNANNAQQASRGMGHFVMGPARRQNCAMGNYANIGAMWLNSPAHRAALLDPSISRIGIAGWGVFWTFNAN